MFRKFSEPVLDVSREVTPQSSPVPAVENDTDAREETVVSPREVSKSPAPITPSTDSRVVTPDEYTQLSSCSIF